MGIVAAVDFSLYLSPQRVWDEDIRQHLDLWKTRGEFELILSDGRRITVPKGFVYNKGSVPRAFWWLMPRDDRTGGVAWQIHDLLYDKKLGRFLSRKEADQIMYELLLIGGMSKFRASLAYAGVRSAVWHDIGWNKRHG